MTLLNVFKGTTTRSAMYVQTTVTNLCRRQITTVKNNSDSFAYLICFLSLLHLRLHTFEGNHARSHTHVVHLESYAVHRGFWMPAHARNMHTHQQAQTATLGRSKCLRTLRRSAAVLRRTSASCTSTLITVSTTASMHLKSALDVQQGWNTSHILTTKKQ